MKPLARAVGVFRLPRHGVFHVHRDDLQRGPQPIVVVAVLHAVRGDVAVAGHVAAADHPMPVVPFFRNGLEPQGPVQQRAGGDLEINQATPRAHGDDTAVVVGGAGQGGGGHGRDAVGATQPPCPVVVVPRRSRVGRAGPRAVVHDQSIRGAKPHVVRGGCHGGNVAVGHPIVPVDADKSAVGVHDVEGGWVPNQQGTVVVVPGREQQRRDAIVDDPTLFRRRVRGPFPTQDVAVRWVEEIQFVRVAGGEDCGRHVPSSGASGGRRDGQRREAIGDGRELHRVVLGVENGEAVRGGNVEAVEVMDCLVDGCGGGPGLQFFELAHGHVVVAGQGIECRRCDQVARWYEVGLWGDLGQVPRHLHGVKRGGWGGAMEIVVGGGDDVVVLNILVDVAVEGQDGPIGCRRCGAGTEDLAYGDDVGVGGGRVVESQDVEEANEHKKGHLW